MLVFKYLIPNSMKKRLSSQNTIIQDVIPKLNLIQLKLVNSNLEYNNKLYYNPTYTLDST